MWDLFEVRLCATMVMRCSHGHHRAPAGFSETSVHARGPGGNGQDSRSLNEG
ncbi:hypothetical protein BN940_12241 [Castellaniella defragrans 65Phen]|uniref:Uncharacterized protein n=1 Tax=Castellaniella defragrans (strain DSM 12143 / CCUG 39792 / 65Phen) TaxID=1437824 RepID=W8WZ78_CASD6|nr:hypothetical protein BN940_12241 [Castellaniella defragrans 65Phen]